MTINIKEAQHPLKREKQVNKKCKQNGIADIRIECKLEGENTNTALSNYILKRYLQQKPLQDLQLQLNPFVPRRELNVRSQIV